MAQWLSWLERRPVTAEVVGPSPTWGGCLRKGPDSEAVGRVGSDLVTSVASYSELSGVLAQLGEHLPYKQRVTGSSPVGPTFL